MSEMLDMLGRSSSLCEALALLLNLYQCILSTLSVVEKAVAYVPGIGRWRQQNLVWRLSLQSSRPFLLNPHTPLSVPKDHQLQGKYVIVPIRQRYFEPELRSQAPVVGE